jgi:hypothetical protein
MPTRRFARWQQIDQCFSSCRTAVSALGAAGYGLMTRDMTGPRYRLCPRGLWNENPWLADLQDEKPLSDSVIGERDSDD